MASVTQAGLRGRASIARKSIGSVSCDGGNNTSFSIYFPDHHILKISNVQVAFFTDINVLRAVQQGIFYWAPVTRIAADITACESIDYRLIEIQGCFCRRGM